MLHMQAKIYGLPPHLLARCGWNEFCFNQEVLDAGAEFERRMGDKRGPRTGALAKMRRK